MVHITVHQHMVPQFTVQKPTKHHAQIHYVAAHYVGPTKAHLS